MTDYGPALDAYINDRNGAAKTALVAASNGNADLAARSQQIAQATGIPWDVVQRNPVLAARADYAARIDAFLQGNKNPRYADWLTTNAQIAHDDIGSVQDIIAQANNPSFRDVIAGAFSRGLASSGTRLSQAADLVAGKPVGGDDQPDDAISAVTTAPYDFTSPPASFSDLGALGKKIIGKTLYGLTGTLPEVGGAIVGGLAGGAAGGAAGGIGAPIGAAGGAFLGAGVTGAALDMAPMLREELAKTPTDPDGAFDRAAVRAATSGAFTGLSFAAFEAKPFAGALKNLAFQVLGVQPAIGAAGQVAQNAETGAPTLQGVGEAAGEAAAGTLAPLVATGAAGLARSRIARILKGDAQAAQAKAGAEQVGAVSQAIDASKTAARSPEAIESLVQTAVGPDATIGLPARELVELFQSGKYDQPAVARMLDAWGVKDDLPEAVATGGDVLVPAGKFLADADTRAAMEDLRPMVRLSPDALTAREAETWGAEDRDRAVEQARQAADAGGDAPTGEEAVQDALARKFQDGGKLSPSVADKIGQLGGAFFGRLAERTGQDPEALFRQYGIEVDSPLPEALRPAVEGADETALLRAIDDLKARRGKSDRQLFGQTLAEWLADHGGVSDPGGELHGQDADTWHKGKPFQRKLVRPDGMHPDDAMLKAWEAGYFPEWGDQRPDMNALFDALDEEMRGRPRYAEQRAEDADAADHQALLKDLDRATSELGIDTKSTSSADIAKALKEAYAKKPAEHAQAVEYGQQPAREDIRSGLSTASEPGNRSAKATMDADATASTLNPNARGDGGNNTSIVDVPAGANTIVYDQPGDGGKRGSIRFETDRRGAITKTTISLFQGRDLSTSLHELGHLFLEVTRDTMRLDDLPEDLRADWKTTLDWLGAKEGEPLTADQHEKFARGFEAYLREGSAPSKGLRSIFQHFMSWLTYVYRSVARLGVDVSPEIKGVFDRMLASEDAIREARGDERFAPLWKSAEEAGLTEKEYARYVRMGEDAHEEARRTLLARMLDEQRREIEPWWNEERQQIRTEVAQEIGRQPAYAAWTALSRGTFPDGSPLPEKVKLDRAAVRKLGGDPKSLPRGATIDGGMHPDVAADLMGFESGEAMLKALAAIKDKPLREVVDAEADRRMAEAHGDTLMDGTLHEKALEALDNDAQGKLLAYEMRILAKNGAKDLAEKVAGRQARQEGGKPAEDYRAEADAATERAAIIAEQAGAPEETRIGATLDAVRAKADAKAGAEQRQAQRAAARQAREATALDADQAHEAAKRIIGEKAVKDATAVGRYAAMELRAARRVEQAIAKRDYPAATLAKRDQLVAHFMAQEARKAATEVDKTTAYFDRLRKSDEKLTKAIDLDHLNAARMLLTLHGIGFSKFDLDGWAKRLRDQDRERAEQVAAVLDGARADLPQPWKEMSLSDFRALKVAVEGIIQIGRNDKMLELDGRKIAKESAVAELAKQAGPGPYATLGKESPISASERRGLSLLGIRAGLMRMEMWCRYMDGGDIKGPFTTYLFRPVSEAINGAYRDAKEKHLEKILKVIEPHKGDWAGSGAIDAPEIGFTFKEGKGQLIHAILHTGTDSNFERLLGGYGWKREGWDALIRRLADQGRLTKTDFDAVQGIWDVLDAMKPEAQAAHKKMLGFEFEELKPRTVETPFGDYKGGYMPAIADYDAIADGNARADRQALEQQQGGMLRPSTGRGFTKGRVEGTALPLKLDLMLIPAHIDSVLRFTHIQPAISTVNRIVFDHEFRAAMHEVDPSIVSEMIVPWLRRSATQTLDTPQTGRTARDIDSFARGLRRRAELQAMVGNIVNALQQFTGLSTAALHVGPAPLLRALVTTNLGDGSRLIVEKSAFMRHRMEAGSLELSRNIEEILKGSTALGKARSFGEAHGHFLQNGFQNIVDRSVWQAAYEKALRNGLDEKDAIFKADQVVRETQGSFSPEDVSRSEVGPAWLRLFTQFYSWSNSQLNMLATEGGLALKDRDSARVAAVYILGMAIPTIVADAMVRLPRGEFGQDEDDGLEDSLAGLFFGSQARYLFGLFPGGGSLYNLVSGQFSGATYDDRLSIAPATTSIEGSVRTLKDTYQIATGTGGVGLAGRTVRDFSTLIGMLTGLPLGQIGKPAGYLADIAAGDAEPQSLGDFLGGLVTGREPSQRKH